MQLRFTKMQGVGNDYIYVDARRQSVSRPERLAVQLADRHFGIGSDGLVLIEKSAVADVKMRMYNADGSRGAMCGNAVRCIAKYCRDRQIVMRDKVTIETDSGVKTVWCLANNVFSVALGIPVYDEALRQQKSGFLPLTIGNPHVVVFPQFSLDHFDIARLGRRLEHSAFFPDGANVEFVQFMGENTLRVRVWERGSGETLGCGTGAGAAAVASVLFGYCDRQKTIRVQLPGGELLVDYRGSSVILTGPAETVFEGVMTLPDE